MTVYCIVNLRKNKKKTKETKLYYCQNKRSHEILIEVINFFLPFFKFYNKRKTKNNLNKNEHIYI